MNRRAFLSKMYCYPMALQSMMEIGRNWSSLPVTPVHRFDSSLATPIELVVETPLDHPFCFWPPSLLSYQMEGMSGVDAGQYRMKCVETGKDVAFQLTAAVESTGTTLLRIISDLPAGERRTFQLRKDSGAPAVGGSKVVVADDGNTIVIDAGPLRIRIPASQKVVGTAPGPIMQVARADRWVGHSTLKVEGRRVTSIHTERLEAGPLLVSYRMTYAIEGGATYVATVDCMAGLDFIRFREDMHGIPKDVHGGLFEFTWSGCSFTNRQMPDHPYPFPNKVAPGHTYEDYGWEPIGQKQINTHIGVIPGLNSKGEMAYAIGVFQPWPVWTVGSFATFWDNANNDAAAIFADRVELWDDPDYPTWHSSSKLEVRFFLGHDKILNWRWPIEHGGRSTCVSFYDHVKDKEQMAQVEAFSKSVAWHDGEHFSTALYPASYVQFLQNRFGTIDLDRVKDFVLTYDDQKSRPKVMFDVPLARTAQQLEVQAAHSSMIVQLALSGTRQNSGFGPVPGREVLDHWVSDFNQLYPKMTAAQRRRTTAMYLMTGYSNAGEDYMPMIPMLSGHPNFLSDVKAIPAAMAYLFPEHPMAKTWLDEFDKFMILNTHYHTRPAVPEWNAKGGRWTENIGTYVWGFLKPPLRVNFLLKQRDGYDRIATPQLAELGDWLVNALSAPFNGESAEFLENPLFKTDAHLWGIARPGDGPRRLHPPIGAHAERRKPPRAMWYLGTTLQQYAPMVAEHLMWASHPTDQDQELLLDRPDVWHVIYNQPDNRGTNPHLRSSKYTGYGITLRAAVDTSREISIHLQQIDDGPNYRWGVPGEGSCGVLYFYAGGKGYSHNGGEDEGDRFAQDTDFGTNFGVWKDGRFRSIGQNVLLRPMYDLDGAQFAELLPRTGPESYCLPEYVSRSVMLAGADYFLLYDHVFNESIGHRLSWFVRTGDVFPNITMLRGLNKDTFKTTTIQTKESVGRWYDGTGDCMVCVTHRDGIVATPAPYGATVHTPESHDTAFFDPRGVRFADEDVVFDGTAGLVRTTSSFCEISLFHGSRIGARGVVIHTADTDLGITATIAEGKPLSGKIVAPSASSFELELEQHGTKAFYVNGERTNATWQGNSLKVSVPQGEYRWELTDRLPVPLPPLVLRTKNYAGGGRVLGKAVANASRYRLEQSADQGVTWSAVRTAAVPEFDIEGLANGHKIHVRLVAINEEHESAPGDEYPLYVTAEAPLPPSSLTGRLREGQVDLTWGEVLGVTEYRLYKRKQGTDAYIRIYAGLARSFVDRDASIHPADRSPQIRSLKQVGTVWEYAVAAVNGNGEGRKSRITDTDPTSWRNWDPIRDEAFRRTIVAGFFGASPNDGVGDYYPE